MSIFRNDILKGTTAVVTGGGTGICRGIAVMLAQHGANVAVMSRKQEHLDAAVAEIRQQGAQAVAAVADVRHPDQVEQALTKAAETFGGIDLLINGAAGNFLAPAAALTYNGFNTVLEIDLQGTFNVSKAAFAYLQRSGKACIINISATLHYGGTPMQCHVSAAKAGIDALTRNLAVEWGPLGIRVNAIAPGPIDDTEGMRRLAPGDVRDNMMAAVPLRRFGRIDEIAAAAVYLASDAAAYINGAILVVDGGRWLNNMAFAM